LPANQQWEQNENGVSGPLQGTQVLSTKKFVDRAEEGFKRLSADCAEDHDAGQGESQVQAD
jgi:hypothetical protein